MVRFPPWINMGSISLESLYFFILFLAKSILRMSVPIVTKKAEVVKSFLITYETVAKSQTHILLLSIKSERSFQKSTT